MSARIGGIGRLVIGGKDYVCVDDLAAAGYSIIPPGGMHEPTLEKIEATFRSLLRGEFSSLTINFNDDHAPNYSTAEGWVNDGFYGADDRIDWVSDEEKEKAISQNSVWTVQWYPETPVGFCCIGASSFAAAIRALSHEGERKE